MDFVLSRRVSLITASLIFSISLILVSLFPENNSVYLLLALSIFTMVLVFRVFGFRYLLMSILTPLIYIVSTFFVFVKFPLISAPFKLILSIIFSVFYYYLLLSINAVLIGASEGKTFPLIRAGKTIIYITTLFASFLAFTIIYKFEYIFIFYFILVFLVSFGLSLEYFWSQQVGSSLFTEIAAVLGKKHVIKPAIFESFIISIIVAEIGLAISFYPQEAFFRALLASTIFYVLLGISESIISHKINRRIYLEYISILMLVLFILILV